MASPSAPIRVATHVGLASLWFALFAQWMTVVPVIVPDQVSAMVGEHDPRREGLAGTLVGAGALVALVVAPVAGARSDRTRGPRGRRRPFLVQGALGTCAGLLGLLVAGTTRDPWWYGLAFVHLQFWWNWLAGAYAGLLPDVLPAAEQGRASGWLNVLSIAGTLAGNAVVALLYAPGRPAVALGAFALLTIACLATTLRAVPEPPRPGTTPPFRWRRFAATLFVPPREHPAFYWVLATRFLANMGVWSVFTFLVFYLSTVVGVTEPAALLAALLGAGALLSVPASLAGVRWAARHGNVAVVRATSWAMAGSAVAFVLLALAPSVWRVAPAVLVFAAAYGAYQAVDWALALAVLPDLEAAGKDMGVWHISMVLPQVLGPIATGWLISWLNVAASPRVAYSVAFAVAAVWFVSAAALVGRVGPMRPPPGPG